MLIPLRGHLSRPRPGAADEGRWAKNMSAHDTINLLAIVTGPLFAVLVTLWWQERKQKHDAKERLFLSLMAHRRAFPPAPEWVSSLNIIDVIFADVPQVVQLWHEYYSGLANPPTNQNYQQREHTYLLMLSAMARHLGYRNIEQTDIDKFYTPQAHEDQVMMNAAIQSELLRFFRKVSAKWGKTGR
jgi:hypothetical protein